MERNLTARCPFRHSLQFVPRLQYAAQETKRDLECDGANGLGNRRQIWQPDAPVIAVNPGRLETKDLLTRFLLPFLVMVSRMYSDSGDTTAVTRLFERYQLRHPAAGHKNQDFLVNQFD